MNPISIAIATIILSCGLGHFIVIGILAALEFKSGKRSEEHSPFSKWIGVFERGVITILVLADAITATVFIFAAKTAILPLRVPKEEGGRRFVEYVILGTLVSYFTALVFGFAGRYLWRCL